MSLLPKNILKGYDQKIQKWESSRIDKFYPRKKYFDHWRTQRAYNREKRFSPQLKIQLVINQLKARFAFAYGLIPLPP